MVKVAVLVKMAPDVAQLKIDPATQAPKLDGLPWKVSDFDKHAVEAAVKLKEAGQADAVWVYTYNAGPNGANLIKEPLAMGCDEAVVISGPETDGRGTAKVLAAAVKADGADLVFGATESLDRVAGEVVLRVAAELGMPSIYNTQKIEGVADGKLTAVRDADVSEKVQVPLPAACAMNDEINHPRLPALMQILQAGKKPIHNKTTADLGIADSDLERQMVQIDNKAPKQDRKNVIVADAAELVAALKKEGAL
ncbi:MAG: electron transfer flavoprotein subunit beta/FixA family protein [Thermoplasmatota archaeon]